MTSPVNVHVQVESTYSLFVDVATLERVAVTAIGRELKTGPHHMTVTVMGDDELRELNREFRHIDRTTDVLSFGTQGALDGVVTGAGDDFVLPPNQEPTLGDIVISYPQAKRQAEAAGRPVLHEIALLTAHGALHLMGFDHAEPEEEKVMFAKTDAILAEVLGPSVVPMVPVLHDIPSTSGWS